MAQTTRCKFKCHSVTDLGDERQVELIAVYPDARSPENKWFSRFTPAGKLTLTITEPSGFSIFEPKKEYYLDISRAPDPEEPK